MSDGISRWPLRDRWVLVPLIAMTMVLGAPVVGLGAAQAGSSPSHTTFAHGQNAGASAVGDQGARSTTIAGIPDNCAHRPYPTFGQLCVAGSAWAPAAAVAADPLHMDVFSNGPTLKVVGPTNQYGLKWQCTELAVRWAAAAFGEGNWTAWQHAGWASGAAQDMWSVGPHLAKPLQQVPNGSAQTPQLGDLLIFHEPKGVSGPGHVAVVLGVNRATGTLTFIGENQYAAPAVVKVPISAANVVSAKGFATLTVTGWLHGRSTMMSSTLGYPVDPICQSHHLTEPDTNITVTGTGYPPGDALVVRTARQLLGQPTVPASGDWTLTFTVPTRPYDPKEPLTVTDSRGPLFATTFVSGAYTCFATSGSSVTWDGVGWDAYSPMTFYIDSAKEDYFSAASNGSLAARTFTYVCGKGSQHSWEVTGELNGNPGHANGTFTCS